MSRTSRRKAKAARKKRKCSRCSRVRKLFRVMVWDHRVSARRGRWIRERLCRRCKAVRLAELALGDAHEVRRGHFIPHPPVAKIMTAYGGVDYARYWAADSANRARLRALRAAGPLRALLALATLAALVGLS